jgi:hypothetical protein
MKKTRSQKSRDTVPLNRLWRKKFDFYCYQLFKVDRNNVKMLKIFWGPKIHSQNIVDGRYFEKILIFNFYSNTISFLIFETIHVLNPFVNNRL